MKILAVANQKGGVGKSTLAVHLALAAQEQGLRVLLVDADKQSSLSLFFKPAEQPPLLAEPVRPAAASDLFAPGPIGSPEVLSPLCAILRADAKLLNVDKAENAVLQHPRAALRSLGEQFDVCIIDTPPLLGMRLMGSLIAADYVVTPVCVGLFEMHGVADLMGTIHVIRTQGLNPRLKHAGILAMKTNNRNKEEQAGLAELRSTYPAAMLPAVLPERAAVRKAIARRLPVWASPSGESHRHAAQEWKTACALILDKVTGKVNT